MSSNTWTWLVSKLQRKSILFFSALVLLYAVCQLILTYHLIELQFPSFTSFAHSNLVSTITSSNQNNFENNIDLNQIIQSKTFEGCKPISIKYEWGKKFKNQKIACLVLSLYPRNKILMQMIGETYGPLCDGLYFILDDSTNHWFNKSVHKATRQNRIEDSEILNEKILDVPLTHLSSLYNGIIIQLNLTRPSHHTVRNTWEKVHRMYTYFYVHYLEDYDWFVRIDDDVLVSMVNLREYLSFFDNNDKENAYYIGHALLDRFKSDNIVYNAGNLHCINRLALSKLGPVMMTLPTTDNPRTAHAHCMDFVAGNDDPHLGTCLNSIGIYPLNTLDYQLKNRFMVFTYKDHFKIARPGDGGQKDWYWKGRPYDMGSMDNCCNKFVMNDHPWISISAHFEWRMRFIEMSNSKWNNQTYFDSLKKDLNINEVIPLKPCTFMYNSYNASDFVIDDNFNIPFEQIPHGQRISNSESVLKCHKCKIGDKDDPYWSNEWDRTMLVQQINDSNKHRFYKILGKFKNNLISTRYDLDNSNRDKIYLEKLIQNNL